MFRYHVGERLRHDRVQTVAQLPRALLLLCGDAVAARKAARCVLRWLRRQGASLPPGQSMQAVGIVPALWEAFSTQAVILAHAGDTRRCARALRGGRPFAPSPGCADSVRQMQHMCARGDRAALVGRACDYISEWRRQAAHVPPSPPALATVGGRHALKNMCRGRQCAWCFAKAARLRRCAGCVDAWFCSRSCQKRAWNRGRHRCG